MRIHLLIKIFFDLKVFQYGFNHKITVSQPIQVIIQIPRPYPCGIAWVHQWSGIGFAHALDRAPGNSVTVGSFCYDIEQNNLKPRIGGLCSNARAHHPRTDDSDFLY